MTRSQKNKPREPSVPPERYGTIRQEIVSVLKTRTLSARDISGFIGVPVKEAYEHLEHIQRSLGKKGHLFDIVPAECKKCGFVFSKRERLKKPGRCPVCRSEMIEEPLFSIRNDDD